MATYDGELCVYWKNGWEGRIEYALAIEGWDHPFFLVTGQCLTIYFWLGAPSLLAWGGGAWVGRRLARYTQK